MAMSMLFAFPSSPSASTSIVYSQGDIRPQINRLLVPSFSFLSGAKPDFQATWKFAHGKGALLVMNQTQSTRFDPTIDVKDMARGNDLFGSITGS